MTGSTEVAVAICLKSCTGFPGGCDALPVDISEDLGTILYLGPIDPEYHGAEVQYANFSVTVPQGFESGQAALSATHFVLVGVSCVQLRDLTENGPEGY